MEISIEIMTEETNIQVDIQGRDQEVERILFLLILARDLVQVQGLGQSRLNQVIRKEVGKIMMLEMKETNEIA